MSDAIYRKLAQVLDTLPNGFPSTPDGLEIEVLKKIFTPEEADLCCDLKMSFETAQQIAARTGRPLAGLEDKLVSMCKRGEIRGDVVSGVKRFHLFPWIVGIYEFQLKRMDREFCELCERYTPYFGIQMIEHGPQMMQVVPIEEKIPVHHQALPFQQVSAIVEKGKRFRVNQCICRQDQGLLGHHCKKPQETCLGIVTEPDSAMIVDWGRDVSKAEALELLRRCEEAGLVHMTSNVQKGHWYICNCCGCCCGMLRAVNGLGAANIVNSYYYAEIDAGSCTACGVCTDERCQVHAIEEGEDTYRVIKERCIGCGLCVTDCPVEAIKLVRKPDAECVAPPLDEVGWNDERARRRNRDYSEYK